MNKLFTFLATIILTSQFALHSQTQIGQDIDGDMGSNSGSVVSINDDGSILAIDEIFFNGNTGRVRVFQLNGGTWIQIGQDIEGEATGDVSGASISLNGDGSIVAIGAPGNDGNGNNAGHVRVYQYNGNNWLQLGQDIDGEAAEDQSHFSSLSSDGTILAIGAGGNDGNGPPNTGHVRVYQYDGNNWIQLGQDINGEVTQDRAQSVSVNGNGSIVAIGARFNDGNGSNSGHVRVYQFDGNIWIQQGQDIDGEAADDESGGELSVNNDGTVVAIGAPLNDGNGFESGHVRVYQYDGNSWTQLGQDIDGEAMEDQSDAVSINNNGSIVAIGASLNDGNGNLSGHARIYQYNGTSWVQRGQDIDGEATDDFSGTSISLNGDGSIVAIGAPLNDGNGSNSGHVRVYDLSGILSIETISNELNITLYPNPANDYVNINGVTTELFLRVYDVLGKEVLTANVTNRIDVRSLKSGTYFVILSDGNKTSTHKFVKN